MAESVPRPTAEHPLLQRCEPPPGFSPGIGRYVAQLTETRAEWLRQVAGLTPAQLSWYPDDETESIGTQLGYERKCSPPCGGSMTRTC